MPYLYHLKFELYPTSDATLDTSQHADRSIWLPPPGTSIFHDLPFQPRPDPPTSFSTLPPRAALRLEAAVKDWRFGRVSIQTVDPAAAVRNAQMSSCSSRAGPSAAPSLGPSFGGAGTATKAEFVPLERNFTEIGWGIVHFYRENEEEKEGGGGGGDAANKGSGNKKRNQEEQEMASSWDDCRTLCIPAVPAYMSPSDFLGFVGDGWRDQLSHCRLVMTSRMNRYLALLNFQDSKVAKKWKREFDGKVFNSVEVMNFSSPLLLLLCFFFFFFFFSCQNPGSSLLTACL